MARGSQRRPYRRRTGFFTSPNSQPTGLPQVTHNNHHHHRSAHHPGTSRGRLSSPACSTSSTQTLHFHRSLTTTSIPTPAIQADHTSSPPPHLQHSQVHPQQTITSQPPADQKRTHQTTHLHPTPPAQPSPATSTPLPQRTRKVTWGPLPSREDVQTTISNPSISPIPLPTPPAHTPPTHDLQLASRTLSPLAHSSPSSRSPIQAQVGQTVPSRPDSRDSDAPPPLPNLQPPPPDTTALAPFYPTYHIARPTRKIQDWFFRPRKPVLVLGDSNINRIPPHNYHRTRTPGRPPQNNSSPSSVWLLERGLSFIPRPTRLDREELQRDLHFYHRRLKLIDHFHPDTDYQHTPFIHSSNWEPEQAGLHQHLQTTIRTDRRALRNYRPPADVPDNLSGAERRALTELITGTAMGQRFAPSYANLYMSEWEREALAPPQVQGSEPSPPSPYLNQGLYPYPNPEPNPNPNHPPSLTPNPNPPFPYPNQGLENNDRWTCGQRRRAERIWIHRLGTTTPGAHADLAEPPPWALAWSPPPYQYLDDIWGTWEHQLEEFKEFIQLLNSHHPSITVKYEISDKQIDFLDTTTYKGPDFPSTATLDTKKKNSSLNRTSTEAQMIAQPDPLGRKPLKGNNTLPSGGSTEGKVPAQEHKKTLTQERGAKDHLPPGNPTQYTLHLKTSRPQEAAEDSAAGEPAAEKQQQQQKKQQKEQHKKQQKKQQREQPLDLSRPSTCILLKTTAILIAIIKSISLPTPFRTTTTQGRD
ncbi:altered inheritance of mitochondria protein 3-like [Myripristis murdjan]|uniref:altered inheritance of mitochondria protein 3-like n=1 Tax=Myripristis murdjan TaxID=586833 RepID=UPI001175E13C|nr:altered inheritance of mitochondria protein 3-like [Myripristis murdjan]